MKKRILLATLLLAAALPLAAQVPQIINYQGKIAVGSTPFTGTGQFRFALVDGTGATSYWSNDGSSTAGSQPTAAVSLPVVNGLYIVPLGDATLTNMTAIPAAIFANGDVRVRVWFNDGTTGSQLLSPDQRITSVGYAMMAGNVPDGVITTAKLAAAARPKYDRQFKFVSGPVILGTALADVTGLTLTTKDLGGAGTYKIEFQATVGTAPSNFVAYINVNGTDVPESISFLSPSVQQYWRLGSSIIVPNLAAGSTIKVRMQNQASGSLFYGQLTIDGVPSSQVLP